MASNSSNFKVNGDLIDVKIKSERDYEAAMIVAKRLTDSLIGYKMQTLPEDGKKRLLDRTKQLGLKDNSTPSKWK